MIRIGLSNGYGSFGKGIRIPLNNAHGSIAEGAYKAFDIYEYLLEGDRVPPKKGNVIIEQ